MHYYYQPSFYCTICRLTFYLNLLPVPSKVSKYDFDTVLFVCRKNPATHGFDGHFPSSARGRPGGLLKQKFVNRKLTASVFSDHNNSACFKTAELLYSIGAGVAGTSSAVFKRLLQPVDGKISLHYQKNIF